MHKCKYLNVDTKTKHANTHTCFETGEAWQELPQSLGHVTRPVSERSGAANKEQTSSHSLQQMTGESLSVPYQLEFSPF